MKCRLSLLMVILMVLAAGVSCGKAKPSLSAAELIDLGEKYLVELDYEEALVQFTKVIEVEPMNVRAYLGGADVYLHLDNQQEASNWLAGGVNQTNNENLAKAQIGVEKSVLEGYIAIAEAYEAESWHDKALELLTRVYAENGDEIIGRKLGIIEASELVFRDDYVIEWQDPEFERLIRQYLGQESGDIHYDDVKLIESIEIWGEIIAAADEKFGASYSDEWFSLSDGREGSKTGKIQTLKDLEHFTSLNSLVVNYQEGLDISSLSDIENIDCLQRLTSLSLIGDKIDDISVVSELIALQTLKLNYNDIRDIAPISMLIELNHVSISNNSELMSAEPLRGLRKLSYVSVSNTGAVDLGVLAGLPELQRLHLVGVDQVDYNVLPQLDKLTYLEVTCDDAVFQIVKQLKTLTSLRLHGNGKWNEEEKVRTGELTNVSGIGALSNLTNLDLLASNCHDISELTSLQLEELEIELSDDCDLAPLKEIKSLKKVTVVNRSGILDSDELNTRVNEIREMLPGVEVSELD